MINRYLRVTSNKFNNKNNRLLTFIDTNNQYWHRKKHALKSSHQYQKLTSIYLLSPCMTSMTH